MKKIKIKYVIKHKTDGLIRSMVYSLDEIEENEPLGDKEWEVIARLLGTGKQDKNGKDIHSGDIVKLVDCGDTLYKVSYFDEVYSYGVEMITSGRDAWNDERLEEFRSDDIEVIGNIYENKDLLKP